MSEFDINEAIDTMQEARERKMQERREILEALGVDPDEV